VRMDVTSSGQAKVTMKIWYSPVTQRRFPVDGKILSRHTANAVLRQAGIAKQF